MTPFEIIRERLELREVVEHYGIEIKRNNTCLCPFHDDHHPSAHVYPKAFHCFTCNLHYDVLGFVMALFGLSALDAAKKLNDDFHLGIHFGYDKTYQKPKYSEDAQVREIQRKKRERFEKWEQEAWQTIHDYLWFMRDWFEKYKPSPDDTYIDERFHVANVEYRHAEEFSIDWIQQFSNEDKVEWKWVVDKMRKFLDEHKNEENPQNPESPSTNFKISMADSPNGFPVNW